MQNRDEMHLAKLRDYYAKHRVLPSFGGMAKLLEFRSTSAVAAMLDRLKPAGYFSSTPDGRLQPESRFFECPLVDTIQAGAPVPGNDAPVEMRRIDERLIRVPSKTVQLVVKGESMIEAGLLPGDVVIVEKGADSKVGDIVVANVDSGYTVKYLAKDDGGFYLRAGNREYRDIRPKESLEIFGVVTGSFRQYGGR